MTLVIGHTSSRKGHPQGVVNRSCRFWVIVKRLFGRNGKSKTDKKRKSQLSNAEYHLSLGQMGKIIKAAVSPRDKLLIQLLVETGMRRGELAALEIADLNFNSRLILVRYGKGNKSRHVPMTPTLCQRLKTFLGRGQTGYVFRSLRSDKLSARQVNRIVAKSSTKAEIVNPNPKYRQVTPHLFRHSFARLWKDKGGDIEALSKILGHQSTKTTWDLYGTLGLEDIQREYSRIMKPEKM